MLASSLEYSEHDRYIRRLYWRNGNGNGTAHVRALRQTHPGFIEPENKSKFHNCRLFEKVSHYFGRATSIMFNI